MIKFFRHIRKRLLKENKFSKYLLYAIGEIALVMIGILLALQVNNWNEERVEKRFEETLKKELYNTVIEDLVWVEGVIKGEERVSKSCEILIRRLEEDIINEDSLDYLFSNAHFFWKLPIRKNSYETAKLHGMHFFKNDSTRFLITHIYESHTMMVGELEKRQNDYYYNVALPILTEKFEAIRIKPYGEGKMFPHNLQDLKSDKIYLNILKTTHDMRGANIYFKKILRSKMITAKEALETEM